MEKKTIDVKIYLVVLQNRVPPDPFFILLREFSLNALLTNRTRNRFGLVTWGHNNKRRSKLGVTLNIILFVRWYRRVRSFSFVVNGTIHIAYPILGRNLVTKKARDDARYTPQ
jgi:hypothetical protein